MPTSTQKMSTSLLDREADARFWAQTHYKVGQKLDPSDPTDKAMAKVWLDIWGKVKREDAAGRLVITYNHPVVERSLDDAATAHQAASAHLDAAASAPDEATAQGHVAAAHEAAAAGSEAAHRAATAQPPTVSPVVAEAAAQEAASAAGAPPPAPVTASLPPDHPVHTSPAALPVLHPQDVDPPAPPPGPLASAAAEAAEAARSADPTGPVTSPASADLSSPAGHPGLDLGAPTVVLGPRGQFGVAQAVTAPSVAVTVHERAHERASSADGDLASALSVHPQTVANIRESAARIAAAAHADVLGVAYSADGQWTTPSFASPLEAAAWYTHLAQSTDAFLYVSYFVRGELVDEVFGASKSAVVREHADPPAKSGGGGSAVAAVAAVGALSFAAIFAGRKRRAR